MNKKHLCMLALTGLFSSAILAQSTTAPTSPATPGPDPVAPSVTQPQPESGTSPLPPPTTPGPANETPTRQHDGMDDMPQGTTAPTHPERGNSSDDSR